MDTMNEIVRRGEWISFQEAQDQLLDLEVERLDREFLEKKGIFDTLKVLNVKASAALSI